MRIRRYEQKDWDELYRLTQLLFPGMETEAEANELRRSLDRHDSVVFVVDREDGKLGGYVEAGARSIVDGCESSPVGFIEAWYVDADLRRGGWGKKLLESAEDWARSMGYTEMGSDALLENEVSHSAHRASGYEETDRVINYHKKLVPNPSRRNIRQAVPFFMVRDIARSVKFYESGLGAKVTTRWEPDGKLQWCWINIGEAAVMLQEFRKESELASAKLGKGVSICFICDDAIAYYKELKSRGVDARTPFVGNAAWVTQVTDPDGYELFFESNTNEPEESVYIG